MPRTRWVNKLSAYSQGCSQLVYLTLFSTLSPSFAPTLVGCTLVLTGSSNRELHLCWSFEMEPDICALSRDKSIYRALSSSDRSAQTISVEQKSVAESSRAKFAVTRSVRRVNRTETNKTAPRKWRWAAAIALLLFSPCCFRYGEWFYCQKHLFTAVIRVHVTRLWRSSARQHSSNVTALDSLRHTRLLHAWLTRGALRYPGVISFCRISCLHAIGNDLKRMPDGS